jgi:hypothetical protein
MFEVIPLGGIFVCPRIDAHFPLYSQNSRPNGKSACCASERVHVGKAAFFLLEHGFFRYHYVLFATFLGY